MSVLITVKIKGDTAVFRQAVAERSGEFDKVAQRGRESGAIHHRFGVGDGFVIAVDEWENPEQFEKFFADPDMHAFVASLGADPDAAPEITVAEAVPTSDQF